MKPDKIKRINKISEILRNREVTTQDDLVLILKKHGIEVTQATLSRDLADIGAVRMHKDGKITYKFPSAEPDTRDFRSAVMLEVVEILHNESVLVIKTRTGCAQSVAVALDAMKNQDILATLAGDDTIVIIPKTTKNIKKIDDFLKKEWNLK
jgi:transcriptional regulator of arginine metabolism